MNAEWTSKFRLQLLVCLFWKPAGTALRSYHQCERAKICHIIDQFKSLSGDSGRLVPFKHIIKDSVCF